MPPTFSFGSSVRLRRRQWKLLVVDEGSRKLIDSVTKEDEILEENITSMDQKGTP